MTLLDPKEQGIQIHHSSWFSGEVMIQQSVQLLLIKMVDWVFWSQKPPQNLFSLTECVCNLKGAHINESSELGSRGCIEDTLVCNCKENVIGLECNQCADKHYGLSQDDPQGCRVLL